MAPKTLSLSSPQPDCPLVRASRRLNRWLGEQALPLWLHRGIDRTSGANHEQLLADGRPDEQVNIRVRVQARQIFTYSFAYCRGWLEPEALGVLQRLRDFVDTHAAHSRGGYSHLLNPKFRVIDDRQDLYDHAFHLLACAWEYQATGDQRRLAAARSLVAFLDRRFGADYGGWTEGDYAYRHRRQNPHMHLFEAFQALYEVTGDSHWLIRAGEIFSLFENRFYCPERGLIFEFFKRDWRRASGAPGRLVEPGHMLEWVWLLERYGRWAARPVAHYTERLYREALAIGQTPSGLVLDEVDCDAPQRRGTKRCWPMTELIKASIAQARAGDPTAEARAVRAVNALFQFYLCGQTPGTYIDRRGPEDEVIAAIAPASTLYHLVIAAAELADYVAIRSSGRGI